MDDDDTSLPLEARVAIAHAVLSHLAERNGVDLLHLKGPALDPTLTRRTSRGTDADVWVRPSQLDWFIDLLGNHGWRLHLSALAGSPFGHATTVRHPLWGYADLHRFFPGVTVDPEWAFDRLWGRRGLRSIAEVPCVVPHLVDQQLILLLNAARGGPHAEEDRALGWDEAEADRRAAVRAAAAELGAEVALAAAIGELALHRHARDHDLWRVTSEGGTRSQEWWARIKAAPNPTERLRVVLRAPLVNIEHVEARLGRPPTRLEIAVEFLSRLARGLTEVVVSLVRPRPWRRGRP